MASGLGLRVEELREVWGCVASGFLLYGFKLTVQGLKVRCLILG